ncbi:hypothetical protein MHU86_24158 [Fragilaria crotonensis]|nr:hypothetical protein MHU86_24158 [Fragilaria crotonensis]
MRVASAISILAWLVSCIAVQSGPCEENVTLSYAYVLSKPCNCTNEPVCTSDCNGDVYDFSATIDIDCQNKCVYCVSALGVCGTVQISTFFRTDEVEVSGPDSWHLEPITVEDIHYIWTYTKGRNGTLDYLFSRYGSLTSCSVTINGQECASCVHDSCPDGNIEPNIDCSNLEAGATATACNSRAFGGWASLDDSALKEF